jgi:uncharacterized membrane protein HdeD (DUF308 family)
MRRFDILQEWYGAHRVLLLLGLCLTLFGLLVVLFPRLLEFIFAAVCITAGGALIHAAFRERRSARELREEYRFDVFSLW